MRNKIILIILSSLVLCCAGCRTSKDFRYIEKSIRQEIHPAKMDKVFRFGTGWISKQMFKCFIRDKQARVFWKEIKKAQFGFYEIDNADKSDSFRISRNIDKCLVEKGWEPFMYIHSKDGDNSSFYLRFLSEKKVSIYAIFMDTEGMMMAEVNGNLKKILEKDLNNQHFAIVDHR